MVRDAYRRFLEEPYEGGLPEFEDSFADTKRQMTGLRDNLLAELAVDQVPEGAIPVMNITPEAEVNYLSQYGALRERGVGVAVVSSDHLAGLGQHAGETGADPVPGIGDLAIVASAEHASLVSRYRDATVERPDNRRRLLATTDGRGPGWLELTQMKDREERGEEPVVQPDFLKAGGVEAEFGSDIRRCGFMTSVVARFETPEAVPRLSAAAYQQAYEQGLRPLNGEEIAGLASGAVRRFLKSEGFSRADTGSTRTRPDLDI